MRLKHIRRLLIVMGCGLFVLIFSFSLINQSAARNAMGYPTRPLAVSIDPANLLVNPDFENGYSYPLPCCNNIAVPIGWFIRWYTDTDPYGSGYKFFQPEVKLNDNTIWPYCDGCAPNVPPRIHTGRYAVDSFKSFGSQDTSLYQQIGNIPVGAVVTGSAWLHAWVSSCNGFPKNFPPQDEISLQGPNSSIDGSCADGAWPDWSNRMMVGIDPKGGIDPRASTVVWNIGDPNNVFTPSWHGPYDYYSSTLPVTVTAQSFTVTIFLRGITTSGAKFSDIYFDSASLTYCCQPTLSVNQNRPWPLTPTVTVTLQSMMSLNSTLMTVLDPKGVSLPTTFLGTTGITPSFTSRWIFNPLIAGRYAITLTAAGLPNPLNQSIYVPTLNYDYVQNHIPPPGQINFTLYSPISLTHITQALTDPLGLPTLIDYVGSNFKSPAYAFHWVFTSAITGAFSLDLFADQFVKHWQIPIVSAADQIFLPITLQGFVEP